MHVRRGVPEISADTSLDTSIARRHAIAAASSQCLIRAGTSASARRAPARGRLPDVPAARRGRVPRLPLLIWSFPIIIIITSSAFRGSLSISSFC